ncbi:amidohydrolase family protein [Alteromonas sp. ASW11-36]|uniref:Amidohydrolase family protein n=1 Tax=Alteromonas arenosi TaxID=3055817 RepID=A0ABT7SYG7_9ALTE|nr:amidohydrolase family protein [Alteromonas sp. ASW11-36]MDM7861210.1 amidohydrolase family protein [Alteromonas sp. ASW11-36]
MQSSTSRFFIFAVFLFSSLELNAKTIIKADALVDVETGQLIKNPVVIIEGNRISQVNSGSAANVQLDDTVIDLSGHTLLPGFMDMHVHLTSDATVHGYRRLAVSVPRATISGVKHAETTLLAGFTTVRNVGAPGYTDVALRDAINDGDVIGPRMFVSGPSIGVTGGHCDNNLLTAMYGVKSRGVADGPWAVREKVRENIKYGATVIKYCATGGVLSKGTKVGVQQYTFEEMQALVEEAHMRGLTVATHAHGTEGIKTAIRAGVDSVEHVSLLDDEGIALALEHGTYFSMDIYVTEYILGEGAKQGILEESLAKERIVGQQQRDSFTRALNAGVKMVFGSDAGVYPHGDNPKQFARLVRFGMTPMQAIQTATIHPATLLKQEAELGSISTGKLADIVAVKGNPLDNIELLEQVTFVMKDGEVYKHTEQ